MGLALAQRVADLWRIDRQRDDGFADAAGSRRSGTQ